MRGNPHYAAYVISAVFAGVLAFYCHRANVLRLIRGEENRLDFKKISSLHSKIQKH